MEIWKDVAGYEGLYQVSNLGNVKTLERFYYSGRNHTIRKVQKSMLLKQQTNKDGYRTVGLTKDGKQKYTLVHRIVAQAFIINDDPENKTLINHKDEVKTNNVVDNLEWCTPKYNNNYGTARERGIKTRKSRYTKEKHPLYGKQHKEESKKKMSERKNKPVICITTGEIFKSVKEASEKTGVNLSNICQCCKGNYKTAGKREWEFLEKEGE